MSSRLFQLRTALLLTQADIASCYNILQIRYSEAERGIASFKIAEQMTKDLENPPIGLLHRLIRIVKFRKLVRVCANKNQSLFAKKAGMSQGAVSVFLRCRKRILDDRWAGILENLKVAEPPTNRTIIAEAKELFAKMRDDDGFQLQNRLRESGIKMGDFAQKCGVSATNLSWWFVVDKFTPETQKIIDDAFDALDW